MAGGGDGKEQNYWPGFVDALSNVVLTLVFVLVVFVFALMITSGKVAQKSKALAEEKAAMEKVTSKAEMQLKQELQDAKQNKDKTDAQLNISKEELAKMQAELERLRKLLADQQISAEAKEAAVTPSIIQKRVVTKNDGKPPEGVQGEPDIASQNAIVITFPRGVVQLNDKSKAELTKVLADYKAQISGAKAMLDSFAGMETYSEGRRLAYYRAMDVRNFLMDKGYTPANNIVINTKQSKEQGDARIEIRFTRQ